MSDTEDIISEAELDLDILERSVAKLHAGLLDASQAAAAVLSRLEGLNVIGNACIDIEKRATCVYNACKAAHAAISAAATRSFPPATPAASAESVASNASSCSGLARCAAFEEADEIAQLDAAEPVADAGNGNGFSSDRIDLGRLQLTRPLVAFDLETTGLDTKQARIVEIAALRLQPDGRCDTLHHLLDPGVTMSAAAAGTHRITAEDLAGKPCFAEVAHEIACFFAGSDILGYNALRYDVPLLAAEFERVRGNCSSSGGSSRTASSFAFPPPGAHVVDALVVFKRSHNFRLASAHRLFCGSDMQNAHTALADAMATLKVLLGQLAYFPGLANTVPALHEMCITPPKAKYLDAQRRFQWSEGQVCFAFGKYSGFALAQVAAVDTNYMEWLSKRDFGDGANRIIADARLGVFSQPPEPTRLPSKQKICRARHSRECQSSDHRALATNPRAALTTA